MRSGREPTVLTQLDERAAPARTALLIVDMQHDFCHPDGAAARAGRDVTGIRQVVPGIRALLGAARRSEVLVCHVGLWTLPNHRSDSGPWLAQRRSATFSAEEMCVANTPGAEFIDALVPLPHEFVIHKHRYSAFTGTNLHQLLRAHAIHTCVVAGASTNVCVESTLRDAFEHDYYVVVPQDATASWSSKLAEGTLENVQHRFGIVSTVAEIARLWTGVR